MEWAGRYPYCNAQTWRETYLVSGLTWPNVWDMNSNHQLRAVSKMWTSSSPDTIGWYTYTWKLPTCPWWRHDIKTFSSLMALSEGNPSVSSRVYGEWKQHPKTQIIISIITRNSQITDIFTQIRATSLAMSIFTPSVFIRLQLHRCYEPEDAHKQRLRSPGHYPLS